MPSPVPARSLLLPVLAVIAGIGLFSAMDAAVKAAALVTGVYTAVLLRNAAGALLVLPLWRLARPEPVRRAALRVHLLRGLVVAGMAPLFFYGLVRIPIAEGIALSFIAPLIALYLASLMLGETIRRSALLASVLGLVGVSVIAAGRLGEGDWSHESAVGTAAILASAVLYAVNLVLQRQQALIARPLEIAFFQSLFVALALLPALPWLYLSPPRETLPVLVASAVLATAALLFLSWGYARAEAQVLLPIEYTGFLWAALFGWLWFDEHVTFTALAGAGLIVAGCLLAGRRHTEQTAT